MQLQLWKDRAEKNTLLVKTSQDCKNCHGITIWQFFSLWYWGKSMMKNQQLYAEKSAYICWDFSRSFHPNPPPTTPFASLWYFDVSIPKRKIHIFLQDSINCCKLYLCDTTFEGQWGSQWTSLPWRCAPFQWWPPSHSCKSWVSCLCRVFAAHATLWWEMSWLTTTTTISAAAHAKARFRFWTILSCPIQIRNCVNLCY